MKYGFLFDSRFSFSGECVYNPIGLHDDTVFPNSAFNAIFNEPDNEAFEARIGRNGWCTPQGFPSSLNILTIDLGRLIKVCAVETAGAGSAYGLSINMELLLDAGLQHIYSQVNLFNL